MSFFKTSVNTYTLEKRFKNYIARVREMIKLPRSASDSIINEIANFIVMQAPTQDEEIELITFGEEGRGAIASNRGKIVPKPNKKGKITSWSTGRVSFMRKPGMYVRQAILEDADRARIIDDNDTFIGWVLGDLEFLNSITRFSYINATKNKSYEITTPYGMFAAFEFGTQALGWGLVKPKYGKHLHPDDTQNIKITEMVKTIRPFQMYSSVQTRDFIKEIMATKVRQVKFKE